MGSDRREFMKTLGLAGATLALGSLPANAKSKQEPTEFFGVLYDSTRCVGCQSCEFACAEAHGLPEPADYPDPAVRRKMDETRRTVVNAHSTSIGDAYLKEQCMHCNEPACVAACLTKAMYKTPEGAVIWRGNKCMGCRYCMVSCPFDIPKFEYFSSNPKILKCDFCYERTQEGKLPVCVENCPEEAIMYGSRRELIQEARRRIYAEPERYHDHIYGEHEAGGTGMLVLAGVKPEELGLKTNIQNESYPLLSKGFLYSVPSVFVLVPALLLGIQKATKSNQKTDDHANE